VVVLTTDNSIGNDAIVVSDNIKSIKDIKGKKVAAEVGSVDRFMLYKLLKRAGMSLEDIQIVPMETSKAADAFAAGKVDAVAVFAPFITKALSRPGSKVLFTAGDFSGTISDHLVFNRKFVNEHPDVSNIFDDRFVNAYAAKTK
jgi:NitT/TauT family transport system substrate-binding protein